MRQIEKSGIDRPEAVRYPSIILAHDAQANRGYCAPVMRIIARSGFFCARPDPSLVIEHPPPELKRFGPDPVVMKAATQEGLG